MKIALKKINGILVPATKQDADAISELNDDAVYEVNLSTLDTRTLQQNRALHLWCSMISSTLNSIGATVPKVIRLETQWTMERVKELIIRPTIEAQFGVKSTTKLKRDEFDLLIDNITKAFGIKGIEIPQFPTREL